MTTSKLLLLSALTALVSAAPQYRPHGDSHDQPSQGDYRGHDGNARVQEGEAMNWLQHDNHKGPTSASSNGYQCFRGDVSKYPNNDEWLSFDALWDINKDTILSANNGNADIQRYIHDSTLQVADESNVNPRLILAAIMQESSGNAAAPCTGHMPNCGIMQASYDSHSFDASHPQDSILQMIREGVQGTTTGGPTGQGGPGYAQFLSGGLDWVKDPKPGNPYTAARAYNSGSVADDGDLDSVKWGKKSYANDVANRLVGWDGRGDGFKGCGEGK